MPRLLRLSDVRATAEGTQTPGYRLRGRGHLNLGLLSILSLVALPVALVAFATLTAPRGGPLRLGGAFSVAFGPLDIALVALAALIVLPVIHELIHGAVAWILGGIPANCAIESVPEPPLVRLLQKNESAAAAVERFRRRLDELRAELRQVENTPKPPAE